MSHQWEGYPKNKYAPRQRCFYLKATPVGNAERSEAILF